MTFKGLRSGWDPIFQKKIRKLELNKYLLFSNFKQNFLIFGQKFLEKDYKKMDFDNHHKLVP